MEFLKDLLNSSLLPFAIAIALLLQVVKNLWVNAVPGEFPKWGDAVLSALALGAAWFFVSAWHNYLPADTVPSILTDTPVQTVILWIETVFSHFILKATYGAGRPVANADDMRAMVNKADPLIVEKAGVSISDVKPKEVP